ncbi:MAG: hypothetical protein AAGE65_00080 [Planctomycetota bacterium]
MPATLARASLGDWRTWLRGAIGWAKAAVRAEPVSDEVRHERRAACARCPEASAVKRVGSLRVLSAASACGVCRCNLRAKTRLSGERCPAGKW